MTDTDNEDSFYEDSDDTIKDRDYCPTDSNNDKARKSYSKYSCLK